MPDIDVDFCFERRPEVIDYVTRKYGKDRVVQIVTFGIVPQYISKIKDEYRWIITVRGKSSGEPDNAVAKIYMARRHEFENRGVYINPRII